MSVLSARRGIVARRRSSALPPLDPVTGGNLISTDSDFEATGWTDVATGWSDNSWGGASVTYTPETTAPHSGAKAQKIVVSTLGVGQVLFSQNFNFIGGQVYEGTIWLRSTDSAQVYFIMRRGTSYYERGACQRLTLTSTWTKYVIRGGFGSDAPAGNFGLDFISPGTVFVDDADIHLVAETATIASPGVIPNAYFGMHLNHIEEYGSVYPGYTNYHTIRLWDTGTRWSDVNPSSGTWNWVRLDMYMNLAIANNLDVIYTAGMAPTWASTTTSDPPTNIADWNTYITAVANRYNGHIKYWEVWNEVNAAFYTGTVAQLVTLTQNMRTQLLAVNPTNVVLSPDFTVSGLIMLADFMAQGGAPYCDIMSVHLYGDDPIYSAIPEYEHGFFSAVRDLMNKYGMTGKPIWNTEGATHVDTPPPPADIATGSVGRQYIANWMYGVQRYNWYGWDLDVGNPLSQSDHQTPTAAGVAYKMVGNWLQGATMTSKNRTGTVWTVALTLASSTAAHIVWDTSGSSSFTIPTGWAATTETDLAGTTWSAASTTTIGRSPIMIT